MGGCECESGHVLVLEDGERTVEERLAQYTLEQSLRQDPAAREQQDISATDKE